MKKKQRWSALIISIVITMIIIITAVYLLEKIIPFSHDIKGVENGNISYYKANTALNESLLSMSGSDPSIEGSSGAITNGSGIIYQITANGTTLPMAWQGNSEYSTDWSILAPGKPIQLILKSGASIDWTAAGTYFSFQIPNLDNSNTESLSGSSLPVINWSLSASGETLQSNGSQVLASEINNKINIVLSNRTWLTLAGISQTFQQFYTAKCGTMLPKCTLKFSLINPLVLTSGESSPYLEYQAHLDQPIPFQTSVIETQGYAGGFRKNITRHIQQLTTNEALDFTVFQ